MKVVVGYDGSEHAKRALERAAELASDQDTLVVVASAEPKVVTAPSEGAHQDPSEMQRRRRALDEAQEQLSSRGLKAEYVESYGDPGHAIVEAGKDADLIVVGSRGLNRLERVFLGSVSTKVVQRANCDVLVVR
jgi:nucleotide-binding universal stress UspA family protein